MRTNKKDYIRADGGSLSGVGHLRAGVFDVNVGRPVEGAEVTIYRQNEDGGLTELESLRCDASGQTAAVDAAAPPAEYSMAPDFPKPYSEYTMRVQAEGFDPLQIDGIQVFDGQLALQNCNMQPADHMREDRHIVIKEHTLWGEFPPKIPEDDEKPLSPPTGFVVLDQPVVPETIVVHDGTPNNTSAPNYYVPFKDYVKNVASSEIYSTWPDATIRANVLAIISFTLNRVFTEWYRGKGKNFTITSSTAYDHMFIYGRNIYESISQIVDEMFTTYITRPGIRQPLLAQYCDGKRVNCPTWMPIYQQGINNIAQKRSRAMLFYYTL